ncbi:hypothetical protein [Deinococcus pimensis]|uniref:hypothetical protein n=1 Tax=Deinococcus pimensis TaxID=309888 RepID=UPI0004859B94|nr:hypothetical protein [Deinococcus pimensis]
MKQFGVRRLSHRDHYRQYFAVTENGVDVAYTDTPEKAARLREALERLEGGHGHLQIGVRQSA